MDCDRCGKEIDRLSDWGNCLLCGDDLCVACSGGFDDEGECLDCRTKASGPGEDR
jgi:hypothetical protein